MAATIQTLATKCEMDAATPLFVGVAWSRGKLPCPLQQFNLKLGEADPLRWDRLVSWDYKSHIYDPVYQQRASEMIYTCSITAVVNRSMEFTHVFPFGCLKKHIIAPASTAFGCPITTNLSCSQNQCAYDAWPFFSNI